MHKNKLLLIDFNRTLYDPDTQSLYVGATGMLVRLRTLGYHIIIATRVEGQRSEEVTKSGLKDFVDTIENVPHKTPALFAKIAAGYAPENVWVVGDVLTSEIAAGAACGFHTIWLKRGKFAQMKSPSIKPHYTIADIIEIEKILTR